MKKNFKNYLANILREPCAREIQTIAFKGMVIILKSLSICQVVPQPPKKGEGAYKYTYPPSSYKPNSQTLVVQIIYKEIGNSTSFSLLILVLFPDILNFSNISVVVTTQPLLHHRLLVQATLLEVVVLYMF